VLGMSALPPKADMQIPMSVVTPKADMKLPMSVFALIMSVVGSKAAVNRDGLPRLLMTLSGRDEAFIANRAIVA